MGYRNRPAFLNLPFENGNNGAVGTQNISETHCHKLGVNIPKNRSVSRLVRVLHPFMRVELRNLFRLPRLNLLIKGLNNHFTNSLTRAHDICRIHRLIR